MGRIMFALETNKYEPTIYEEDRFIKTAQEIVERHRKRLDERLGV